MAFMIRSPAGIDAVGKPDVSVVGIVAPVAVVVEIVIADDVGCEVVRRAGIVMAVVASFRPTIERIGLADLFDIGIERIGAAESAGLSAVQRIGLPVAGGLAFAFADGNDGVAAIFAGINAVVAGLSDRKCQVRGIDLEIIAVVEPAHGEADGARSKLNLYGVVIEIEKRESRIWGKANHSRSKLNFGAGILVGPKFVAGGHGTVGNGSDPVIFARGLEGNGALHVSQASDSGWRIVLILILGERRR